MAFSIDPAKVNMTNLGFVHRRNREKRIMKGHEGGDLGIYCGRLIGIKSSARTETTRI